VEVTRQNSTSTRVEANHEHPHEIMNTLSAHLLSERVVFYPDCKKKKKNPTPNRKFGK
jgi:hypothetical protein